MHRCEPAVLDHEAMLGLGLRHIVEFVVAHLEDERVRARAGAGAAGRERGRERRGRGEAGAGLGAKGSVPARLRYAPWRLVCSRHAALRPLAPRPPQIVSPEVQSRLMHMVLEGVQELVRRAWLRRACPRRQSGPRLCCCLHHLPPLCQPRWLARPLFLSVPQPAACPVSCTCRRIC